MSFSTNADRAQALFSERKFGEALPLFDAMSKSKPRSFATMRQHAICLLEMHRPIEALEVLDKISETSPPSSQTWFLRARCHNRTGATKAEENCLRRTLELEPGHATANYFLAQLCIRQGDLAAAHQVVSDFRATGAVDRRIELLRAQFHENDKEHEPALELYQGVYRDSDAPHLSHEALAGIARTKIALRLTADLRQMYDGLPVGGDTRRVIVRTIMFYPQSDISDGFPMAFFRDLFHSGTDPAQTFTAYAEQLRLAQDISQLRAVERSFAKHENYTVNRLAERIAALKPPALNPHRLPPSALQFWRQCRQPGQSLQDWSDAAHYNTMAKSVITQSMMSQDADLNEICSELDKFCDRPDFALVEKALARQNGCLIAGSHLGSFWPTLSYLDQNYANHLMLGGYARHRVGDRDRDMFIRYDPPRTMRRVVGLLKKNAVISCAPDGVHPIDPLNYYETEFGPVPLQSVHPRLQYSSGAQAIWLENYWRDGRLVSEFKTLPAPKTGETRDAFVDRWNRVYLDYMVDLLKHRLPVFYDRRYRLPARGRLVLT